MRHIRIIIFCAAIASALSAAAQPALSLNPTQVNVWNVSVSSGPTTFSVIMSSAGNSALDYTSAGIELVGDSAFSIVDMPSTAPMEAGTSRTLVGAFDPVQDGSVYGTLRFHTTDGQSPLREVQLHGSGIEPDIYAEPSGGLGFGNKVVNDPEPLVLPVYIYNYGSESLQFTGSGVSLRGSGASSFQVMDDVSTAPLQSSPNPRRINVGFRPTTAGPKIAFLDITTNDPDETTVSVILTGTPLQPRPAPFIGAYNGYGPGQSTIGTGGHYSTLQAACDAASAIPLTGGNWTFRILNDLNEANNSIITQRNTGGHKIIFRPAPGTNPVVSFTTQTVNHQSMPGHILVGARPDHSQSGIPWQLHPTRNIIIDGSNDPATSTTNLTLTNSSSFGRNAIIHVRGDCDFIDIRNCRFEHTTNYHTTTYGELSPVEIVAARTSPATSLAEHIPDNCSVTNCDFTVSGVHPAPAIAVNLKLTGPTPGSLTSPSKGMEVTQNRIVANTSGIMLGQCFEAEVSSNTIHLQNTTLPNAQRGIWIAKPVTKIHAPTSARVDGNKITYQGSVTSNTLEGILVDVRETTGVYHITNNMISGITAPPTGEEFEGRFGIRYFGDPETTALIAHNSMNFHHLPATSSTLGRTVGIECSAFNQYFPGNAVIRNNIIRMEAEGGVALGRLNGPGTFDTDYNIIWAPYVGYLPGPTGRTPYLTLAEWQLQGHDENSLNHDPAVAVGMENAHAWTMGDPVNPDMHWTGYPGISFPTLTEVPKDIDGEQRYPQETMPGADEVDRSSAVDMWQSY